MNTILYNANIYTVNPAQPRATALAISHGRIVAVGSDSDVGNIVLPDATAHRHARRVCAARPDRRPPAFGVDRLTICSACGCMTCPRIDDAIANVRTHAQQTPTGKWMRGRGWNQADWGGELPTAAHLDAATTQHPVFLNSRSGHSGWANSAAMRLAGVDENTANPQGRRDRPRCTGPTHRLVSRDRHGLDRQAHARAHPARGRRGHPAGDARDEQEGPNRRALHGWRWRHPDLWHLPAFA